MHTIEEAKKLWCPHNQANCVADKCFHWRWRVDQKERDYKRRVSGGVEHIQQSKYRSPDGFCALEALEEQT